LPNTIKPENKAVRKRFFPVRAKSFKDNTKGSTAIEFAMLAIPFSGLLFAIIETAIVFFITSTMSNAVSSASRQIRTGQFQASCSDTKDTFKDAVCANMAGLGNCQNRLRIDVVKSSSNEFKMSLLPAEPEEDATKPNEETPVPESTYTRSGSGEVVIVRAQYFHKLALPGWITFLPNRNGNIRMLQSTTAFKNEPFPGTCS